MASDTGLQRDKVTDLLSLPYFIIQHLNRETFKFIKIKSQEVRQDVWNSFPLSLITLHSNKAM